MTKLSLKTTKDIIDIIDVIPIFDKNNTLKNKFFYYFNENSCRMTKLSITSITTIIYIISITSLNNLNFLCVNWVLSEGFPLVRQVIISKNGI